MARGRNHYWILAVDPDTDKPYLIYGGATEDIARQHGIEMLGQVDFEIRALPTTNLQRASSLLKGKRLEDTHSLSKASQRLGHDKSVKRMRHKKHRRRGEE